MPDPVARAIANAPIEDEPISEEERQAVARSEAWFDERGGKAIALRPPFTYSEHMEVHLNPETEKKLKDLAAQSGRGTDDLVEDAMAGYVDELLQVRRMLDSRYDDLKSGRAKPRAANAPCRRAENRTPNSTTAN
jgi:hypothetical protein